MVEKEPDRLALAERMGVSAAVVAGPDQDETLRDIAPDGFSVVVDATGVPQVIERSFDYLRPRGQYLQFGVTPMQATVQLRPYDIFRNDWHIIGSFALCYTFLPAIAWLANGTVDVASLVSHQVPFDGFSEMFGQFAAGRTLKVHVQAGI